jgi:hypothetical protein
MFLRSQTSSIYSLHAKQISTFSFEMHLILRASEQTTAYLSDALLSV